MKEEKIQVYSKVPGYVMVFGVVSLILVIIGFIVPVIGAGVIIPIALVFSTISLYGNNNGLSIATTIISAVKLIISPTFWVQFSNLSGKGSSTFAWISIICLVFNLLFIFNNSKNK